VLTATTGDHPIELLTVVSFDQRDPGIQRIGQAARQGFVGHPMP
jgi:hypothetical protein